MNIQTLDIPFSLFTEAGLYSDSSKVLSRLLTEAERTVEAESKPVPPPQRVEKVEKTERVRYNYD